MSLPRLGMDYKPDYKTYDLSSGRTITTFPGSLVHLPASGDMMNGTFTPGRYISPSPINGSISMPDSLGTMRTYYPK